MRGLESLQLCTKAAKAAKAASTSVAILFIIVIYYILLYKKPDVAFQLWYLSSNLYKKLPAQYSLDHRMSVQTNAKFYDMPY